MKNLPQVVILFHWEYFYIKIFNVLNCIILTARYAESHKKNQQCPFFVFMVTKCPQSLKHSASGAHAACHFFQTLDFKFSRLCWGVVQTKAIPMLVRWGLNTQGSGVKSESQLLYSTPIRRKYPKDQLLWLRLPQNYITLIFMHQIWPYGGFVQVG